MGTGIAAAIPIVIKPREFTGKEYFSNQFFTHFDKENEGGIYTIKIDFLLEHYFQFLKEFYELIGETEKLERMEVPILITFEEFEKYFSFSNRNGKSIFIYNQHIAFSFSGGQSSYYWHFYSGSYKAIVEVYSTFLHFERILQKTMKNPLAQVLKFGIFG